LNPLNLDGTRAVCLIASDLSETKRAEQELRASSEQLRSLAGHLLTVREEERARISREVHDELGQSLTGQSMRISTATAVSDCTLYRIEKALMVRMLHEQHGVAELFITHLLTRYTRFEEDLVDQLFNSSEKRLARILLILAHFGKESRTETVHPGINQEHMAQMVGTTRSRVSHS
jgi:CRP-like cAMP-binding protein